MPEYDLPRLFDTVVHMLQDAGETSPDHVALICEGEDMTYQSFVRCVAGFARELEGLGARGGRGRAPVAAQISAQSQVRASATSRLGMALNT